MDKTQAMYCEICDKTNKINIKSKQTNSKTQKRTLYHC